MSQENGNDRILELRALLGLLNLRLTRYLQLADVRDQEMVHDLIVDIAIRPDGSEVPQDAEDSRKIAEMSASLTELLEDLRKRSEGAATPFEHLEDTFSLDGDELLLLTAVLAPALDPRFRTLYTLLQGTPEPGREFLLSLTEPDDIGRYAYGAYLSGNGTLLSRALIETTGLSSGKPAYRPARGLVEWLNGYRTTETYNGHAEWTEAASDRDLPSVPETVQNAIKDAEARGEPVPIVSFYGPDMELLMDSAQSLAGGLGRSLLKLNLSALEAKEAFPLIRFALRDCALNRAVLVLTGSGQYLDSGSVISSEITDPLRDWNVPVIFLTAGQFLLLPSSETNQRPVLRLSIDGLSGLRRFAFWKECLKALPMDVNLSDDALRTLAGQFTQTRAQIRAAVNSAYGQAIVEGREIREEDLYEGARLSSMHHLSDLAKKMTVKYTIADLILPEKQKLEIDNLINMARNRSKVLEEWGVGKKLVSGQGISALFTGVPGTGKTLSAQVIAGELGLDMYRVDLSSIVSKYIGETEKNLERIFTEAQNSNVILFFDEADSLFSRRSDVSDSHDRYANIEVGYLLQRIETYNGIVLMATNLGANLDEAFARRIHFIIDFPFPDEETRQKLWELLLPDNIQKEPDIDLAAFAASFKIAGGNIRNAVVWAIYAAARDNRPVSQEDLLRGVEREFQKMGKVFPGLRY